MEKLKLDNLENFKTDLNVKANSTQIKKNLTKNTQIKQATTNHFTNQTNNNSNLPPSMKYNNNYFENEFAFGQLNKNNCNPDSVVKVSKTQPIDRLNQQGIGNASQIELINQQLANLQKDVMVDTIKQNKLTLGTKVMMENERAHAQEAIETGIYVTWCSKDVSVFYCCLKFIFFFALSNH